MKRTFLAAGVPGSFPVALAVGTLLLMVETGRTAAPTSEASASSNAVDTSPQGAIDGDRFSAEGKAAWKGKAGEDRWWWQIQFSEPRRIGAILQIIGDHPTVLRNAPRRYFWSWSDGVFWHKLRETETLAERRLFRIHRLREPVVARALRLQILDAYGEAPTLREAEFYPETTAPISFGDWIVAVSTAEKSTLPAGGQQFIQLAHACKGWESLPAQEIWLGSFDEAFVATEPRPLCALLTGNSEPWCQKMQEPWRGTQEVLQKRNLPLWTACGGAQGLALLQEFGLDRPWDCPCCRDPKNPLSPIYTHIGYTSTRKPVCGDTRNNIFERGKSNVLQVADDPVFAGLPAEFEIMQSHCGQIDYVPKGWIRVVSRGTGAQTINQCLRIKDRYIYAAQFHMEMKGTPENSRTIMSNFLTLAKQWGGYNPHGKPVPEPTAITSAGAPRQ